MNYPHLRDEKPNDALHVLDILNQMRDAGLEPLFISSLMEHCLRYPGIRDLMELWSEESNAAERDMLIVDMQESIDDIADAPLKPEERPTLPVQALEGVQNDVIAFKRRLRDEVDRQGGISELARRTGIPQPSLSRFFNSKSMPRRTTIYKIAKALQLSESALGFTWFR